MNTEVQARLETLVGEISGDPILGSMINKHDLETFLKAGLSQLLQTAVNKDRQMYMVDHIEDRANGFSPERLIHMGTTGMNLRVPRTRGGFYPTFLPKHQRSLPDTYEDLFCQILLGAKSFRSAIHTLQSMDLGYSVQQVESVLEELDAEAKRFLNRPLASDWLFVYLDAKVLALKDDHEQVKTAVHFLAVGISSEATKEILTSKIFWGNEQLDCWRQVLVDLKNRGLSRVLMFITDDFSGLTSLIEGFFPQSDHQLCCVHLFRNAQRHLSKDHCEIFRQTWKEILATSSFEVAQEKFQNLLTLLNSDQPAYVKHLQARIDHYLAFLKYPRTVQNHIHSTNLPEGLNNLIETLKRNAGGHFHSEREARIKMKLLVDRLYASKWSKPHPIFKSNLQQLMQIFKAKFEQELPNDYLVTQKF